MTDLSHCEAPQPFLSLRGGVAPEAISMHRDRHAPAGLAMTDGSHCEERSLFRHCEERSDEAISSQHEMTQLSHMHSPSTGPCWMLSLPPCSPSSSTSTSSPTKPKSSCTPESQTTSRNGSEHNSGPGSKSAGRYGVSRLVYFEVFENTYEAISREKQIKAGPRRRKVALIEKANPRWRDLASEL